jgi:hypothetical protein
LVEDDLPEIGVTRDIPIRDVPSDFVNSTRDGAKFSRDRGVREKQKAPKLKDRYEGDPEAAGVVVPKGGNGAVELFFCTVA